MMITCEETLCYHCGENCETEIIVIEDKYFCCDGCRLVYELLSEHNLDAYYQLEKQPGNSIKTSTKKAEYAYLDLPEVQETLLDFREKDCAKITIAIPSIHCSSCVYLLENLPRLNAGAKAVMVDFIKREAVITFDEQVLSLRALIELLDQLGYAPDLSKKGSNQLADKRNKTLAFKIGLAGFCFGNIMLLSFPEYFILKEGDLAEYQLFFGVLNFFLALPVLLYCAQDYFIGVKASWQQKMIGIDVPIVMGLIALFGRSTYEIFTQTGAGYMDSFAGLVFFLLIGKWYQSKTYQSLAFERDYTAYFPMATTRVSENGEEEQTMIEQLQKGDVIKIRSQEIIPADSILLSDHASIDYSFVSGESDVIVKTNGDKIYAGGRQLKEAILLKITKAVNQSYFTRLWNQPIFQEKKETLFSQTIQSVSRFFTLGILSIALITLGYWLWVDSAVALIAFSSVLIIACPCALALSAPFAFGNVLRLFGRDGLFLKNALVVEQLAGVTDIIFDKTGTLTTNKTTNIQFVGGGLGKQDYAIMQALVQNSTHPLSQMISNYIQQLVTHPVREQLQVIGFKETSGKGIEGWIAGKHVKIGSASFVGLTAIKDKALTSYVYVCYDNKNLGCFTIQKKYREGIKAVLKNLEKDYYLHLLSGDNASDKLYLEQFFAQENSLHFGQAPLDKFDYVRSLQREGRKVLMIGDGLNDAGALRQADVGIAISNDVHSFSPASDGILDAKQFNLLNHYLNVSQKSLWVIKASVLLSLLYNTVGLFFAVQGLLTPLIAAILMPLSSISVVIFTTVLTSLMAGK